MLADRYVVGNELGTSAMSRVWRARDQRLGRDVAVKEIVFPAPVPGGVRASLRARLMREARAAAGISGPSAVAIYDVVEADQRSFVVMELVDGPTLETLVESEGPLFPARAAELGLELVDVLESAHSAGVVHRDISPRNVMLTRDGHAKLADLGIASLKGDAGLTTTGVVLGSPSFMAPEQAQGEDSGPAADMWSLGATLYYAVEGRPPFERDGPIPTLAAVVYDEPSPPERSGELEPVLRALLEKPPAARPKLAEVRYALAAVVGAARSRAAAPDIAASRRAVEHMWARGGQTLDLRRTYRARPTRALAAAAVIAAFLIALLAGMALFDDDRAPGPRPNRRGVASGRSDAARRDVSRKGVRPSGTERADTAAAAPGGWVTYTEPVTGWRVAHPPGWRVIEQSRDEDSVDIADPSTGTYLRIDWTSSPQGSPAAAWRSLARGFAATHHNYEEIGITPTTFLGYPAAVWEFTYTDGGSELHAADLGFVTETDGFALFFQTHAEDWAASQHLWDALRAGFRPPPGGAAASGS